MSVLTVVLSLLFIIAVVFRVGVTFYVIVNTDLLQRVLQLITCDSSPVPLELTPLPTTPTGSTTADLPDSFLAGVFYDAVETLTAILVQRALILAAYHFSLIH